MTTPIEPRSWRRFAAEFTRQHEGWPLVIESPPGVETSLPELEAAEFHGIAIDDESHKATLILGEKPDGYLTYSFDGVRTVSLESYKDRSESAIRMELEDGRVALLHFELSDAGELAPER